MRACVLAIFIAISTAAHAQWRDHGQTAPAAAVVIEQGALVDPGANEPPKVEFIEVEGLRCLQPVVLEAGAQLADYRAAEARWLAGKYPGVPAPEAKTEILLSPATDGDHQAGRATVQRETFYLDGIVGAGAVICFEIKLTTTPG